MPSRKWGISTGKINGDLDAHADLLCNISGQQFYNTSRFTFTSLLDDTDNIAANLAAYLNGFSPNVRDVVAKFDFVPQVDRLEQAGVLRPVLARFAEIDLHPDAVSNLEMGYIYEELIRVTADLSNEEAGEHFTPREVIRLMVNLLLADEPALRTRAKVFTILDPACGTGGMLSEADARLMAINPSARVHLFGQEVNPESYAVCRSDMMLKGQDAAHIVFGSSLSADGHAGETFDYILANPPYGKDWKSEAKAVEAEARLGHAGRFGAGLPPTSDGQLLFVQHMVSKMRTAEDGGSRVAVVLNGSPLFSGDAGSGPSEIRRWLIENDWLEAIIGLPDQMFYNTGIYTYIWLITNRKAPERAGHVLLIDARDMYAKMRKSLGNKRNELTDEHIATITALYEECASGEHTRVVPNTDFGYNKITVERPLRQRWEITDETLAAVEATKAVKKVDDAARGDLLAGLRDEIGFATTDRKDLDLRVTIPLGKAGLVTATQRKPVIDALAVRDPDAPVITKRDGAPEPDSTLRDTENVPLGENIDDYVTREVLPWVPDAWVDHGKTKTGYEIPFTRLFYKYVPPRPLAEIDADIKASQQRILALIAEVAE